MDFTKVDQRGRSSFDSKVESPRLPNRMSFDASRNHRHGGAADQLRASFDARDLSSRTSLDIKDVVRASFQKERSRSSVDGRDGFGGGLRESPRSGHASSGSRQKDPPRSSVDGWENQSQLSVESPRLSVRLKDAVRAAVEGRMDLVRASFDSKESLRSASNRSRETPRTSSTDSRLLVELRESPRLSRDAPRYSCDGRDGQRSATTEDCSDQVLRSNNITMSRESLRADPQKAREAPRHSVDGRGGVSTARHSVGDRESPRLQTSELPVYSGSKDSSSYYHHQGRLRSETDGKDQLIAGGAEPRRRVPSLVARLMGLEDLPDEQPVLQHVVAVSPPEQPTVVPQQIVLPLKKPSKESKLLKGLLQYNPRPEDTKTLNESRHLDDVVPQIQDEPSSLKHMYSSREQQQQHHYQQQQQYYQYHQLENTMTHNHQASIWNGMQESPKQLKLSPKQLGMETMPPAYKQQEAREIGALRQKVVRAMPKQLTEAVLTVLKNADDKKRLPMSYADMENRLRQLRLRSSLQDHKTLRQILEAMQSKGLLNSETRPKETAVEYDSRPYYQEEVRSHPEPRYQNPPKQIMLPKPQESNSDSFNASKFKNLQELKKLGTRLQEQVFCSVPDETVKSLRSQHHPVNKVVRSSDEQQSPSGASIVVMKPIGRQGKKTSKAQNPALLIESMPGPRSPQRGIVGRTSPWGSPVNRSSRTSPGFGFGRESTGRFSPEESAAFKFRRERIAARSALRDIQLEPVTPRSPKLIALPQSKAKLRSSVSKELPESSKHLRLNQSAGSRSSDNGRRLARSTSNKEKEENTKAVVGVCSRSQSSRDLLPLRKQISPETEQPLKDQKLRRSSSDGKMSSPVDREMTKLTTPAEVTILRNRPSSAKRVTLPESDSKTTTATTTTTTTATTTTKRGVFTDGSKQGNQEDKTKERISAGSAPSQPPTTPRSVQKNVELSRKKEEVGIVLDHVRITDGDAIDQSITRSPLVGLTNRLQSPEVGLGEIEREGQGIRTPRTGILVKKICSPQEEPNLPSDIADIPSEQQQQPSPVSVLDAATFCEEDVSPLALNKTVDGIQDHCAGKLDTDTPFGPQADTALQERKGILDQNLSAATRGEESCPHLAFLRESAKILPPQGQAKQLILRSQAEKVYVRDILVVSGATMGRKTVNRACDMISSTVFDYLEEKQVTSDYELGTTNVLDEKCDGEKERRFLFDCVNDVLETMLVPYVNAHPWMQGLLVKPLRRQPTGQILVQQLWDQLQSLPPQKPCDDICDSLYNVLQKDLVQPINSWMDYSNEIEDIGLEIEKMIFKELIEQILFDMVEGRQRKQVIDLALL